MEASARAPEDLYGLPLEDFTPARDALAKELKAAGRKDEAAEVKKLRKPSVAAWALNRVARERPEAIEALRGAGADLRVAQEEALAGDAGRLRDAGRDLAEEVDRVAALAAEVLQGAGRPVSAAQQEKIVSSLRTAAVDDEAGDALARGVLVDELDSTGFLLLGAGGAPAAAPARPSKTTADGSGAGDGAARKTLPGAERPARKTKPSKEAQEAMEAARRELRRYDAEADMAATRARRRAERAEAAAKRAAEAQREAEEARVEAEDAAGEAEAARRAAAEAADRLAEAEAALDG
ncbi:MAG TPA: hypothetical protein VEG38_15855 [Acidimicrobiia bacterium]|nr:hypothetical protein [Acidimicrobiia bacterium]